MPKRLPENLQGAAHYRRSPDDGPINEAARRAVTLPRVQFLEGPEPDNVSKPNSRPPNAA